MGGPNGDEFLEFVGGNAKFYQCCSFRQFPQTPNYLYPKK